MLKVYFAIVVLSLVGCAKQDIGKVGTSPKETSVATQAERSSEQVQAEKLDKVLSESGTLNPGLVNFYIVNRDSVGKNRAPESIALLCKRYENTDPSECHLYRFVKIRKDGSLLELGSNDIESGELVKTLRAVTICLSNSLKNVAKKPSREQENNQNIIYNPSVPLLPFGWLQLGLSFIAVSFDTRSWSGSPAFLLLAPFGFALDVILAPARIVAHAYHWIADGSEAKKSVVQNDSEVGKEAYSVYLKSHERGVVIEVSKRYFNFLMSHIPVIEKYSLQGQTDIVFEDNFAAVCK